MDFDSAKEQIRAAIDIVALVSRYVPLQRSGRMFVGRCPWHDDSRPSLQVNPQRQSFKCWVCDIGGDIFAFVMKVENVDFKEALQILADIAEVKLPSQKTQTTRIKIPNTQTLQETQEEAPTDSHVDKKTLYKAVQWVAERYHQALLTLDEARPARDYLDERGITRESINTFRLGYAPLERDWLTRQLKNNKQRRSQQQQAILAAVGVLADADNTAEDTTPQRWYDRFRGRIIFPIIDQQDRAVAFGGRLLPNTSLTSRAKYINSPETPLFAKHRMLYGLPSAHDAIRKAKRVLVMEGYTDCIIAHQYGFRESVAVLGTALGSDHVRLLNRFTDRVILILDGDAAGRRRANEVIPLFLAQGVAVEIVTIPEGRDPAEFLEEFGEAAFAALIDNSAQDALTHALTAATRGVSLSDVVASSRVLDELVALIAQVPTSTSTASDPIHWRLDKTIQILSQRFGIAETDIRRRLHQHRQRLKRTATVTVTETENIGTESISSSDLDLLEREMLELWIADSRAIGEIIDKIPETWFRFPVTRALYSTCVAILDRSLEPTFERLMLAFDSPAMKSILVSLDESGRAKRMGQPEIITDAEGNKVIGESREEQLTDERRAMIVAEIVRGFERRYERGDALQTLAALKDEKTSPDERSARLADIQHEQRQRREITLQPQLQQEPQQDQGERLYDQS